MRWAVFLIESIETSCSRRAFDPCLQVTTLMAFATESDKTRVLFEHAVSDLTYDADGATVRVVPVQASPVGDPIPKPVYVKFPAMFSFILAALSRMCVGIRRRRALPYPVCA